jgi:hypothetical protein
LETVQRLVSIRDLSVQTERVPSRIEPYPPAVGSRLESRLASAGTDSNSLRCVKVLHSEVEVELLRLRGVGPGRVDIVRYGLDKDPYTVHTKS